MLCSRQKVFRRKTHFILATRVGNSDSSEPSPCSTYTSVTHMKSGFPQQINISLPNGSVREKEKGALTELIGIFTLCFSCFS